MFMWLFLSLFARAAATAGAFLPHVVLGLLFLGAGSLARFLFVSLLALSSTPPLSAASSCFARLLAVPFCFESFPARDAIESG